MHAFVLQQDLYCRFALMQPSGTATPGLKQWGIERQLLSAAAIFVTKAQD